MTAPSHAPNRNVVRNLPANAYTLIELLVTVAIIAVLAVISFAAFSTVRQKAAVVTSMAGLRQMGTFQSQFAAENYGGINTVVDSGAEATAYGEPNKKHFWGRYQPYFMSEPSTNFAEANLQYKASIGKVLASSDASKMTGTPFSLSGNCYHDSRGLPVPFAFNSTLYNFRQDPLWKIGQFPDPAQTIHMTYGRYYFDKSHGDVYVPFSDLPSNGRQIWYLPNKTALAVFLDGHVEAISPPFDDRHYGTTPTTTP